MTTARDVIAKAIGAKAGGFSYDELADRVIDALLSAPVSVRQELAALLNPWRPISTDAMHRFIAEGTYEHLKISAPGLAEPARRAIANSLAIKFSRKLAATLPLPAPPSEDKT